MKHVWILFVMLLALPAWGWAAERVELNSAAQDVSVNVLESSGSRTVVRFDVNAFTRDAVEISGQNYYTVNCGREAHFLNAGEPDLPRICRSIIIPDDAEMEIKIVASQFTDYPSMPIAPSKGNLSRNIDPATVPYSFGSVYESQRWYPGQTVALREPYILRDLRGTVIEVYAFQYMPVTQTLRVYTSVTVAVESSGQGRKNVFERRAPFTKVDPAFNLLYQRHFLNYGTLQEKDSRYTAVDEQGEMLIITADSFRTAMQPFYSWKIQKGIKTTMVNVSTIGNNSTSIKNYIQNFYTSTSGNLAYALLVGDAAQVATIMSSDSACDPKYAKVAGADNYPDIFIGRFSAQLIAHVNTQVERSIEYERDATTGASWCQRATGIASAEGDGIGHNGGEIDYEHMGYIRTDLLGYGYTSVDQIYDPGATAAQVSTALNAGRGFVNYIGHGSTTSWSTTGFNNTNITNLTNDNLLPFIFSVACVNGQFHNTTCFAEYWLRSVRSGQPIGALATYMASVNQSWLPPMDAQDEATDIVCAQSKTTFGGICFNASCKMIDLNGTAGAAMFNTWHIFGDPSVQVRTKTPTAMSVSHASQFAQGQTTFNVTVTGVSGALCALTRNDTIYGAAYTNGSGLATITISGTPLAGQTLKLAATAFNKVTYTANIPVVSAVPHLYLTTPNGGEIWYVEDLDSIKWTSENLTENIKIEINRSYPEASWETIIASTPNDGSHPWTVAGDVSTTARVRIAGTVQTGVGDTSAANFTIALRTITVAVPNGGETWIIDNPYYIQWTSQNVTGDVCIELNRDYPAGLWDTLAPNTGNDGIFEWYAAPPTSGNARIRVSSLSYPAASDVSDGPFTVVMPNDPPAVLHDPLHDQMLESFTVTAIATDDASGFTVRMIYWPLGGAADSADLIATANPDEYAATVGPFAEDAYVYFIRVQDAEAAVAQTDTFTFDARPGCVNELVYDDGTAEAAHWSENRDYRWAVKFDPTGVPFLLYGVNIGISAEHPDTTHSLLEVQILNADGPDNLPGSLLLSKQVGSIGNEVGGMPRSPDNWTYAATYDEDGDPLALTGSFYVAVSNPASGHYEAFLHDTSSTAAGRSYVYDPCDSVWYSEESAASSARSGNRLIRAHGFTLVPPQVVSQVEGDYVRLSWTNLGVPLYKVYCSTAIEGPYTFFQSTSDTLMNVARTDTAGIRQFYQVQSATE
ncbi:hypothetical protein EHM69_01290 [candidate division KSB1 bacterium]|nr:MAG: hypothetical protein EHM69_01290 [candidate division KSB1 bacterium]